MSATAAQALCLCTDLRTLDFSHQGAANVRALASAGVLTTLTALQVCPSAESNL